MKNIYIALVIVASLLLVAIGGWLLIWSIPPSVEADEGYAQIKEIIKNQSEIYVPINKNVSAITVIDNGQGEMNLTVELTGYIFNLGWDNLQVELYLSSIIKLPSDLQPSGFKFVAGEPDNGTATIDFDTSFDESTNATPWPSYKNDEGEWAPHYAYIGFTPNNSNFRAQTHITWRIYKYTTSGLHTLRIKAVLLGYKNSVVATIDIVLDINLNEGDTE